MKKLKNLGLLSLIFSSFLVVNTSHAGITEWFAEKFETVKQSATDTAKSVHSGAQDMARTAKEGLHSGYERVQEGVGRFQETTRDTVRSQQGR